MAVKMERECERENLICLTPFTLIYLDTRLPIFLSIGENANCFFGLFSKLWIAISLRLSASTIRTYRHGGRIKILHVGNSCKNRLKKIHFLLIFSKTGIFAFCLRHFTEIWGSTEWLQKFGISWKLFRQRAPIFFIGTFLKVHWTLTVDRTGAPLMPFGRGKVAT